MFYFWGKFSTLFSIALQLFICVSRHSRFFLNGALIFSHMEQELAASYSISDLERLSGIKAHTIRVWEKRYNIFTPHRTDTNIRFYSEDDLKKLLNISILNKNGYKISELGAMSDTDILLKISSSIAIEINSREEKLLISLLEMDESLFHSVFKSWHKEYGFESTISDYIFPFFERIGIMWQCGTINPAQEHFFSNLIRGRLITETDRLGASINRDAKNIVLFLPEGEQHEIALLFYNYMFKKRGYRTIYLGQSVPFSNLERVYHLTRPFAVVTGLTTSVLNETFVTFCRLVCEHTDSLVYFTGPVPQKWTQAFPDNARFLEDLIILLGQENLPATFPPVTR